MSNERNIAVVGCGYWGKNLVRNFAELRALRSICDVDPKKLEYFKSLYPWINTSIEYSEVLQNEEIKGVVIASPAVLHYSMAKEALLTGKDTFVEKPLALKVEEGKELVELAEEKGKIIMVGHLMLYHPAIMRLKEYLDSGSLGDIRYIYSSRLNLGIIRRSENVLWSLAPHDISVALYLLDMEPMKVCAQGTSYVQPGIEDVVFITMVFPGNKLVHHHVSWLDPSKTRRITVVGSDKMAVFDDMESVEKLRIYDKGVNDAEFASYGEFLALYSGDTYVPKIDTRRPLSLECEDFIHCIQNRGCPRSGGKEAVQVLRILDAAQQSLNSRGQWVTLSR